MTRYIVRRIRFLRGENTQEEFSRKVGISRSALANYESGRSLPNEYVLAQIAARCEISESFFDDADLTPGLNGAALLGKIVEGTPDWTDDELAMVRLLRLVPAPVAAKIAADLVEAATTTELSGMIASFGSLTRDVATVMAVQARGGLFRKGSVDLTGDALAQMARKRDEAADAINRHYLNAPSSQDDQGPL
ncbi:helix-turn-helix transcriptional regulator [Paracoccaceae bacterium Fryx2]|nr:helix-turn-helix transcriptional regulator [Paracoccaceae bacterium Fryx2]